MSLFADFKPEYALWRDGPVPGALYEFPNMHRKSTSVPRTLTSQPTTTSSSIVAFTFDKGVIMAGDILASYGSWARFDNCPRIMKVNDNLIFGASGDYADFQFVKEMIEREMIKDECYADGFATKPSSLYSWLTRTMYYRRSKMNPLWLNLVVAGIQNDEPFLGMTDKLGTAYTDKIICTGYGLHFCNPMLRDFLDKNPNPDVEQAKAMIKKCMEVLFYRDARSYPKYQLAIVTKDNVTMEDDVQVEQNWQIADM